MLRLRCRSVSPDRKSKIMRLMACFVALFSLLMPLSFVEEPAMDNAPGTFEMRLTQHQPGEGLVEMELESSKEEFFVSRTVRVSIADVASAKIVNDAAGGFLVRITFLPASKKKVEEFTEKNIDRNVALF